MMKHKKNQRINPTVICAPCDDYKNKQLFINTKIKQTILICNTKYLQGVNPMGLGETLANTYLHSYKLEKLGNCLESNQCIDGNR